MDVLSRMLSIQRGSRGSAQAFFILHRAILVSSDMRYARKVKLTFIVRTISRLQPEMREVKAVRYFTVEKPELLLYTF